MKRQPFDVQTLLAELSQGRRRPQFTMRIDADGGWHYQGSVIPRAALVKLFSTALHRAADGSFWLVTPVEAGRVEVADVPFTIKALERIDPGPDQVIRLCTNLDEWLVLDAAHPLAMRPPPQGGPPAPYVTLRPGFEARLLRPVFYELVEQGEVDETTGEFGVRSAGGWFGLGRVDPA